MPEVHHPIIYRPASLSSPGSPPFVPSDIRKAYNFLPLYSRGIKGNGTRIAIIDAYGDSSLSTDLSSFNSLTGLPPVTLNTFYPDGPPKRTDSGWALETALDVEWAHSIAPSATIDLVVAFDSSLGHIFDGIAYVANSLPNAHQLFVTITSHGATPFASSGDSGAATCCNPQYPASDPLVVAVGGTSLTLNSDASYGSETTWTGSGAGSSTIFTKPTWQQGLGDSMRDIVDVAYVGDPNTGVLVVRGGLEYQVGGTSAGSPQWAALIDLASQANGQTYGSINSKLYKLSSYHDITLGSDNFFTARPGWDYPTGLGTPDANAIVNALSQALPVLLSNSVNFGGQVVTTTGNLLIFPTNGTLSGTSNVVTKNSTTGMVVFNKTFTIPNFKMKNNTGILQASFLLSIGVSPYPLSSNIGIIEGAGVASSSVGVTRRLDANGDGIVDILDLARAANAFGTIINSPGYDGSVDVDGNGAVNIIDISIMASYFDATDFI